MRDEEVETPGVLWQLFAPILWRLVRPYLRPRVACALSCEGEPGLLTASIVQTTPTVDEELSRSAPEPDTSPVVPEVEQQETGTETSSSTARKAFNDEICDDTLPPYIGLPRWMPGTRLMSDGLRAWMGCEPPPEPERFTDGAMPPPVWTYPPRVGMPPPVALLSAPEVPGPRFVRSPVFGMPPPVLMTTPLLPSFEPTVGQVRWLQSALTVGNFDPGPIDGAMGKRTEAALERWREVNSAGNVTGNLTEWEFEEIVIQYGDLFDQVQPGAPLY